MSLRTSALLVAALAATLVTSAHAAPPAAAPRPLTFTDASGDANGVNDSGGEVPVPLEGVPTSPASLGQFDLTAVSIAATGSMATRVAGRRSVRYFKCTGFAVTMTLAAPPQDTATMYRLKARRLAKADAGEDDEAYYVQWRNAAGGNRETVLRYTYVDKVAGLKTGYRQLQPAKVEGNKVTIVVTAADIAATGERLGGLALTRFAADVRGAVERANVPMWDQLLTDGKAVWKVCPA